MSVQIIVDSTADMTEEVKSRVRVVPLTVNFGEEEYIDGVTIDHRQFYQKLMKSDVLPRTSQAGPAAFEAEFEKLRAAGDTAVVLTLSSQLSGTYQSAMIAAAEHEDRVFVVDTGTVAIASGILAELALRLRDQGLDARALAVRLAQEREKLCVIAMLDTLEYLKRGGRISKTAAFAGSILGIKPVVTIREGKILILGKARGSKQGNNLLIKEIEKAGGVDFSKPLLLGYTGLSDALLWRYIEDSRSLWAEHGREPRYTLIGSVIGTHAGPGAIAAAFFRK